MTKKHYIAGICLGLFLLLVVAPVGSIAIFIFHISPEMTSAEGNTTLYEVFQSGLSHVKYFAIPCGIIGLILFLKSLIEFRKLKKCEAGRRD